MSPQGGRPCNQRCTYPALPLRYKRSLARPVSLGLFSNFLRKKNALGETQTRDTASQWLTVVVQWLLCFSTRCTKMLPYFLSPTFRWLFPRSLPKLGTEPLVVHVMEPFFIAVRHDI